PPVCESLEQLAVGQADVAARGEEPYEMSPDVPRRCARHDLPSATEPTQLLLVFPMAGRRNTLFSLALASWCAISSGLGRPLSPDGVRPIPPQRTIWRAPGFFLAGRDGCRRSCRSIQESGENPPADDFRP